MGSGYGRTVKAHIIQSRNPCSLALKRARAFGSIALRRAEPREVFVVFRLPPLELRLKLANVAIRPH